MNEFVEQFLLESRELVDQATADLLVLEENPDDRPRLDSAFRAFHTLKGSAGIVDFAAMATAAHAAEDLLVNVRAGKTPVSRTLISHCLRCLDLILQWLDAMQVDGAIPTKAEVEAATMVALFASEFPPPGSAPPATTISGLSHEAKPFSPCARTLLEAQLAMLQESNPDGLVGRILSAGRVAVNVLRSIGLTNTIAAIEQAAGAAAAAENPSILALAIDRLLAPVPDETSATEAAAVPDTAAARVLRIDVERIDALVKLTGELMVAKNAVGHAAQLANTGIDPLVLAQRLKDQHVLLGRLVEELQQSVLMIRVLPLRHVFHRFPKLVREIAETLGKSTKLVTQGDDTEADKVVVESLFEPLLHIMRNALDHGVETAAERSALGKPPTATITLRASRSGDVVLIEVEDDGRGIDLENVRSQALKREIADADTLAQMCDEDIIDLVFAPGFSTASVASNLSGRGVGMDIVRSTVARLGGTARLSSQSGHGTRVTLRLPFSVMMTKVMSVQAGGQMFGLPLDSVIETVRLPRRDIFEIGQGQAVVLRNRTIPLFDLAEMLGCAGTEPLPAGFNTVIVSYGGQTSALKVDSFGERMDVILKPMDGLLNGLRGLAGTSLLGDGSVLIVLDLQDFLQ